MKKALLLAIALCLCINAYAADVTITLTIPSEKVETALEGWLSIYPNSETIPDPEWVDPEDGSEALQIARWTNKQWVREKIRRILVRDVRRGLTMKAQQEIQITEDNDIAQ